MSITVAALQLAPTEDTEANLDLIEQMVRGAVDQGARLVVLPEYAVFTAPAMDDRFVDSAQPLDGPTVTRLVALSERLGVAMVVGVNESAGEGRIHNTLLALDGGQVRATYRKVHLYDAFGYTESDRVEAAEPDLPETFEVDGLRIGMQTCYDLRFPETTRMLMDAGVDVVALPAEWVPGPLKEDHWRTLVRARAIENTVHVVAAGQCAPTGAGNTMVVDPMGVVLASLGEAPGTALAQVDPQRTAQVRLTNPALSLRRYHVLPGAPR
ncbi:carbon-nitrogen hydrolase family protein [uncultured Serinicoccus sp.]|uniref:carbon-nitrogen hydrolase family protein n=1 Tax=uncultured Serinicoccus sp. TaxID=735514 RepID=UPI002627D676|nr:carbon-nitrogen hydrolase family protein [uncultured Serinicoccus sp.]